MSSTPPPIKKELTTRELNAMIARRPTDPDLLETRMLMTANNVSRAPRRSVQGTSTFPGWATPVNNAEIKRMYGVSTGSRKSRRASRRASRRTSRRTSRRV